MVVIVATGRGAAMTTDNAHDQMRRQDTLNALGEFLFGFAAILILSAEFLFLNMLDELVFHSSAPFTPGWLSTVLIATYGVRYASRSASMQSDQEKAQETIGIISDAFEQSGFYVIGADAADVHDARGYTVYCRLHADDWDNNSEVCLSVDNEGVVFEVDYHLDIQRDLTLVENLVQAQNDLDRMHDVVQSLDIPFEVPGFASYAEIPAPLRQAFLSGSMYEEIIMNPDELGSSDGAYISGAFWTSDEENWSDATGAYLSVGLMNDW